MTAIVRLLEAVGTAPGDEQEVGVIHLLDADVHSVGNVWAQYPLRTSGAVTYAFERWVRWQFTSTFTEVRDVRLHLVGFDPASGWRLKAGVADAYQRPTRDRSEIALVDVPTTQESGLQLAQSVPPDGYTDWAVVQASTIGRPADPFIMPNPGLTYRLTYKEA